MVKVGVHVSIAGSIDRAVSRAEEAGCDTFQIFSRNPRGWGSKDLDPVQVRLFRERLAESGIYPPVDHMPYLPNLASADDDIHAKSMALLASELKRCDQLGIPYLVTHLGHNRDAVRESGRRQVIRAINAVLDDVDADVMLLLENTAGEANSVGSTFEDIRAILDGIRDLDRIGFCFDTCHAFAAGYELRTEEGVRETLRRLDGAIGLCRLEVVHVNDARGDLGSGLDRHEHIGMGAIGEEGFRRILRHPAIRDLPLICETPVDSRRNDVENILKVRELAGEKLGAPPL
ncbi:MAG: deoxyribonuclease IV [Methanomicrobiales archaeon]|nr:deoxyribonuclease IV [Methanomicrobiales archaeon]MDI6875880.1 deoxyribonuclease IV [Methanomicrobiales archaeon]